MEVCDKCGGGGNRYYTLPCGACGGFEPNCSRCGGSGIEQYKEPCDKCNGFGYVVSN